MSSSAVRCKGMFLLSVIFVSAQAAQKESCEAATFFQRANDLLAEKLYDQAAQSLDLVSNCARLSPVELFELGWLYGRARHFQTALQIFTKVPPDIPDAVSHAYAAALSQFELSDYKSTVATLEALQSRIPLDEKAANLLAVAYSKLGLYREAYAALSKQLEKGSADLTSYLNLVTVCAEGGDFQSAAKIASRATQLFPKSPEVLVIHGAASTLIGKLDEAFKDFSQSMQLAPHRSDSYFFLALTDYKQGNFVDAVAILRRGIGLGLQDSDLHYLLAECVLQIDAADTEAALQELNRAVDLNASSVSARTLRGKLLLQTGHPAQAVIDLEFAKQHDPNSRSAIYNLAQAYRATGRAAEAQAIFDGLRNQPSNTLSEMSDRRLSEVLSEKGNRQP